MNDATRRNIEEQGEAVVQAARVDAPTNCRAREMSDAPGTMQFVPHSEPIDLSTWGFLDATDQKGFAELIMRGFAAEVTDVLREQFKTTPPMLKFASEFVHWDGHGGDAPSDPVMLYVELPLGKNEDACCYSCSLEGSIDSLIDLNMSQVTGKIEDAEAKDVCAKVSARLRELAQKLDDACAIE